MRKLNPTESEIQQAVIKWWALSHKGLGVRHERLLMAFPMQGQRSPRNGARMKAEGMRAGLADMLLAVPVWRMDGEGMSLAGLWIELKRPKGSIVSKEQCEFLDTVREQGYAGKICYGFDECIKAITDYLKP